MQGKEQKNTNKQTQKIQTQTNIKKGKTKHVNNGHKHNVNTKKAKCNNIKCNKGKKE